MAASGEGLTGRCDVLVVGGGPAGAVAALRLAGSGFDVILLDCARPARAGLGETLPPHGRLLLQRAGVWEAFSCGGHLASSGITSYWGADSAQENDFLFNPYGCGWHLDRARFDACRLDEAERRGVRVLRRTRMLACAEEKAREVRVRLAGDAGEILTGFIVDATGRPGAVRRSLSRAGTTCLDRLLGLARHGEWAGGAPASRALVEATRCGWWYSSPTPGGGLVSVFFTDADFVAGTSPQVVWNEALRVAPATAERVRASVTDVPAAPPRAVAASSFIGRELGADCWAAIGDAAMAWDPLSSQGICKALESGLALAETYEEFAGGDAGALRRFYDGTRESFSNYLALRSDYYSRETRWPDSPFWRRRTATGVTF
jgi:2-polyprenyl-6-methoxyphenol hydroxylase-like FAD-dependent oxidoreductase